jgi:glycerate kinase
VRIVIAPNCFRDCLSAAEVAAAMLAAVERVSADALVDVMPTADGGDGTVEALKPCLGGRIVTASVRDARGRIIEAEYLVSEDGKIALVEMAQASGLCRIGPDERDAWVSNTYGTGQLIADALGQGVDKILVGAGGSATLDAGAGALAALGARFLDPDGHELDPTPKGLQTLARVDISGLDPRLKGVELTLLPDVDLPLRENTMHFGGQKGIRPEDREKYVEALERLDRCARDLGSPFLDAPWGGAGGGISGGLAAFAGGVLGKGAEVLTQMTGLKALVEKADLVLTGEGKLDASSFSGKTPGALARLAAQKGIECHILAGQVPSARDVPVEVPVFVHNLMDGFEDAASSIANASSAITNVTEKIVEGFVFGRTCSG